jgi:hypothetical protein
VRSGPRFGGRRDQYKWKGRFRKSPFDSLAVALGIVDDLRFGLALTFREERDDPIRNLRSACRVASLENNDLDPSVRQGIALRVGLKRVELFIVAVSLGRHDASELPQTG